jgi:cytosine/adenosine deaminase-related metal-dependent hydrolase
VTLIVRDGLLVTMAEGRPDPYVGWFDVGDDGRITAIGAGERRGPPRHPPRHKAPRGVDAGGAIVAPGFVSAHSHLFTSGTRGMAADRSLYGWIDAIAAWTRRAGPDDLYWATLHGSLDFLNNGITSAYDFCHGLLDFEKESDGKATFGGTHKSVELLETQLAAKLDSGLRFVNSVTLDDFVGTHDAALDRVDHIVAFAEKHRDHPGYLGSAVSGAVQWAPDPSTAEIEVEVMRRHGIINQPHFLETPHEIELQRSKFAWYRDAGAFGPDLVFGHFIQTTDEQIVEAAAHGCGAVWQATSNGRLASGVAAVPRWRELGMRVGVGLDDQACTDVTDPFQNMRIGIYTQRAVHKDPMAMPVRDMLELHTRGSAEVLGIEADVGSLEVGKYGDFLVVDPRSPDTGPTWDVYGTYVLACSLRNLKQVWVGGELVSDDGRIVTHDTAEVNAQLHARMARLTA